MKCIWCKKEKGDHKAVTLACPIGPKTKIGFLHYSEIEVFTPKENKK